MILFLDFDGVLHPFLARSSADAFCYLSRLETVLREFPDVQIVIASTQREAAPLALLARRFSPDIAARIVGATPIFEIHDAGDVAGSRHREILAYLDGSGADWLALDDDASLFPPGCAELVLSDDGFHDAEERALRAALSNADERTKRLAGTFVEVAFTNEEVEQAIAAETDAGLRARGPGGECTFLNLKVMTEAARSQCTARPGLNHISLDPSYFSAPGHE